MRQIIHEHSHVHCVSPRPLEVTHSPCCPGQEHTRSRWKVLCTPFLTVSKFTQHQHTQAPHIPGKALKSFRSRFFSTLETNHQALTEAAKHCPLLSGNQKSFVAQGVMMLVMVFNQLSLLSTVFIFFFQQLIFTKKTPKTQQQTNSQIIVDIKEG